MASPPLRFQNAAADASEVVFHVHGGAEWILLRKLRGNRQDVVFAPFQAGAEKGPQVMRGSVVVSEVSIELVALQRKIVDRHIVRTRIANGCREQRQGRKVVVDFQRQRLFQI